MKILVIADSLETFRIHQDCTYIMMQKLSKNKHSIYTAQNSDLYLDNSGLYVNTNLTDVFEPKVENNITSWYNCSKKIIMNVLEFDAVLMRTDPPYDMEYLYGTHLLEYAHEKGVVVINSPHSLRQFPEKTSIFNYPEHIAPTCISKDKQVLKNFINEHGACILKPLDFMSGYGVVYIDEKGTNLGSLIDLFASGNNHKPRTLMIQKFLPSINEGDKRILIINNTIVPYRLTRLLAPEIDAIRSNIGVSGKYSIDELSASDLSIAKVVQENMKKNGIFIVGLDIIGESITEINITSPGGFQEITGSGLVDVGEIWYNEFIDFMKQYKKKKGGIFNRLLNNVSELTKSITQ